MNSSFGFGHRSVIAGRVIAAMALMALSLAPGADARAGLLPANAFVQATAEARVSQTDALGVNYHVNGTPIDARTVTDIDAFAAHANATAFAFGAPPHNNISNLKASAAANAFGSMSHHHSPLLPESVSGRFSATAGGSATIEENGPYWDGASATGRVFGVSPILRTGGLNVYYHVRASATPGTSLTMAAGSASLSGAGSFSGQFNTGTNFSFHANFSGFDQISDVFSGTTVAHHNSGSASVWFTFIQTDTFPPPPPVFVGELPENPLPYELTGTAGSTLAAASVSLVGGTPVENAYRLVFPVVGTAGTVTPYFGAMTAAAVVPEAPASGFEFTSAQDGPAFAAFSIPYALSGGDSTFQIAFGSHLLTLAAGSEVDFTQFAPDGVRKFTLFGIDVGESIDPASPPSFAHGFRFIDEGTATVSAYGIATVPEPSTLASALVAAGCLALWPMRRCRSLRGILTTRAARRNSSNK